MSKFIKYVCGVALMVLFLCAFGVNQAIALEVAEVQPAETISYQEPFNVNSSLSATLSSYFFQGTHVGSLDGTGGVLFANGTIINVSRTAKDNGPIPVTLGDDMRVDGEIWRGTAKGTSDNMPLKISDTMVPTMDDINDLGDPGRRWQDLFLSGILQGNNAIFSGDVEIENLHVVDNAIFDSDIVQSVDKFGAVKAMAYVESDGTLVRSKGPKSITVDHSATGTYIVDFNVDLSQSFFQVTQVSFLNVNPTAIGSNDTSGEVNVLIQNTSGSLADAGFMIIVY